MNLHKRPLFVITAAWILGVVCAVNTQNDIFAGLCVVTFTMLVIILMPAGWMPASVRIVFLCVFTAAVMRTAGFQKIQPDDISNYANGKNVHLYGVIASDPESVNDKTRFVIRAVKVRTYSDEFPCSGNVAATLYPPGYGRSSEKPSAYPSYGQTISIHGRLKIPEPPGNPGQVDYDKYLSRRRIFCTISSIPDELTVYPSFGSARLASVFNSALNRKASQLFPSVEGSLLMGIMFGNYTNLPYDVQTSFMRTGTMHLLAASGYNCGILIIIFGYLFRFFTVPKTWMNIALIVIIWLFVLVAGCGPSIVRAALMVSLVLIAYIIRRRVDYLNIMMFAALMILIVNPLYLYDVGFQLSFSAVAAIMLIIPLFEKYIRENEKLSGAEKMRDKAVKFTLAVIITSAVSIVATWPITAYYFNYFSLSAILANAVIAALILPITGLGITAFVFGFVPGELGHTFALLTGYLLKAMLFIVNTIGGYEWSAVSVRSPLPMVAAIYYAALICSLEYVYRKASNAKKNTTAG
ncbi:MAG: ComEC/Rec2 family competence protein [Armatimonadota bacterium]